MRVLGRKERYSETGPQNEKENKTKTRDPVSGCATAGAAAQSQAPICSPARRRWLLPPKLQTPFTNAGAARLGVVQLLVAPARQPRVGGAVIHPQIPPPAPSGPAAPPLRALQSPGSRLLQRLHRRCRGRPLLLLLPPPPPLRLLRLAAGLPGRRQPRGGRAPPLLLLARRHGSPPRPPPQEHRAPPQGQAVPQARHLRDRPGAACRGGGEGRAARRGGGGRGGQRRHGVVRGRRDGVPGGGVRARVREPAADLRRGVPQPGAGPCCGVSRGGFRSGWEHYYA